MQFTTKYVLQKLTYVAITIDLTRYGQLLIIAMPDSKKKRISLTLLLTSLNLSYELTGYAKCGAIFPTSIKIAISSLSSSQDALNRYTEYQDIYTQIKRENSLNTVLIIVVSTHFICTTSTYSLPVWRGFDLESLYCGASFAKSRWIKPLLVVVRQ